jgi:hypothetical protein
MRRKSLLENFILKCWIQKEAGTNPGLHHQEQYVTIHRSRTHRHGVSISRILEHWMEHGMDMIICADGTAVVRFNG